MNEFAAAILKILKNQVSPISAADIRAALPGFKSSTQQLTRALAKPQREGRVTSQGNTKARRYLLAGAVPPAPAADLPLSPEVRVLPVQIGASVYLPLGNPQLLEECFRQLVLTAQRIDDPYECSFFLLVHLPYLQPFLDGNKRTARLAANLPFVHHNLVPLRFVAMAEQELAALNEITSVRYGLRPSELAAWESAGPR